LLLVSAVEVNALSQGAQRRFTQWLCIEPEWDSSATPIRLWTFRR